MRSCDLTSNTDQRNAPKTPELLLTKGFVLFGCFDDHVQKCFPVFLQDLRSR